MCDARARSRARSRDRRGPWRRAIGLFAGSCLAFGCHARPTAPDVDAPTDPSAAVIATGDLANFWAAYDGGGATGDAGAFQRLYIDRASPGLQDFAARRGVTAASVAAAVRAYPRYYAAIRPVHRALVDAGPQAETFGRIRTAYARLRVLYPAATFPPLTLLAGRFSTAGTTSANGLLVGLEFYGREAGTPLDELNAFARANVRPLDALPGIVAHEWVHTAQARLQAMAPDGASLLHRSLLEGAADFLGELASGQLINDAQHQWARGREAEIWAEFSRAMDGADVSRWLYNQGSATDGRPGDLGYVVGYWIVKAYHDRAPDKAAAIRAILEIRDARAFLRASGFGA